MREARRLPGNFPSGSSESTCGKLQLECVSCGCRVRWRGRDHCDADISILCKLAITTSPSNSAVSTASSACDGMCADPLVRASVRRLLIARAATAVVAVSVLAACRATNGTVGAAPSRADPQIVQDVIDATYMVPGDAVRRAMRVNNFLRGVGLAECGGEAVPLESTYDRYSQDLYPDLSLIRARGFVEKAPDYDEDPPGDCSELAPDGIPSWSEWFGLIGEWTDISYAVKDQDADVAAERPAMASCLQRRTGLSFDAHDPTTFLRAVNEADAHTTSDKDRAEWAVTYAGCGADYFDAMESALMTRRPALIERNRELLERFAADLSAAGYVP